jgi:hypothetical protein
MPVAVRAAAAAAAPPSPRRSRSPAVTTAVAPPPSPPLPFWFARWSAGTIQSHAHVAHWCHFSGDRVLRASGMRGVLPSCECDASGVTHAAHDYYLINKKYLDEERARCWHGDGELY